MFVDRSNGVYSELNKEFLSNQRGELDFAMEHVEWAFEQWLQDRNCAHRARQYAAARLVFAVQLRSLVE